MPISYHDPRGQTRVAPEPYGCRLELKADLTIGLLANGFPDSVAFLDAVESALQSKLPNAELRRFLKPSASAPADSALVQQMAEQCDAIVAAYGH